MITIAGKDVYTEIDELVAVGRTALVLIDMQRDFVSPDGAFAGLGIDVSMYRDAIPRMASLLDAARTHGVPVVHLQNTQLDQHLSDSPAQLRFNLRMHAAARQGDAPLRYTVPGTPGHEFIPELAPRAGEAVVPKYRSSGFWATPLDLVLRSNGVESVVVAGCTTEGCVESTARDALFNDFHVVIAQDCVASDDREQHDASMLLMSHRFDLADSGRIAAAWSHGRPARPGTGVPTPASTHDGL